MKLRMALFLLISTILVYVLYPYSPLPSNIEIDKLVVDKSERKLMVYSNGKSVKSFPISLGENPIGHKHMEGDEKTPEGIYSIHDKMGLGESGYYKNLGISYPSSTDKALAKKKGINPGGEIKIHGIKNGLGFIGRLHRWKDWTNGCIALTNEEIDDLYKHVQIGTPIEIRP
ncbi:MAG: hypothetical protein RL335_1125 [Bacteroidota bacterium]